MRSTLLRFLAVLLFGTAFMVPVRADIHVPLRWPLEIQTPISPSTFDTYVPLPAGALITSMTMRVNNLEFADQGSVMVGSAGTWIPLDNANATVTDTLASHWQGIGGPIENLHLKIGLPAPVTVPANGRLRVRFSVNHSFGNCIGYRVLSLGFQDAGANELFDPSTVAWDDPSTWQPYFSDDTNIQEGKWLWESATLTHSDSLNTPTMNAHCSDCHAADGRDLQYFNYSNQTISIRAQFHGLTRLQGQQIASYIRSLPYKSVNGRPWNPPYQPGPGLDSEPVSEWAAGAGTDWILEKDSDMLPYLFPNGISKDAFATSGTLNFRETPQAFPLPCWNQWLPKIHPLDSPWAAYFAANAFYSDYADVKNLLTNASANGGLTGVIGRSVYPNLYSKLQKWVYTDGTDFVRFLRGNYTYVPGCTSETSEAAYSTFRWRLVKEWELMQQFQLEDKGALYYAGDPTDRKVPVRLHEPRTWFTQEAFNTSPHAIGIQLDKQSAAIGGSTFYEQYFTNAWYHVQLVLNPGNGHRTDQSPFDYSYSFSSFGHVTSSTQLPNACWLMEVLIKGGQESDDGQGVGRHGWNPWRVFNPDYLAWSLGGSAWQGYDAGTIRAVLNAFTGAWLDTSSRFSAADYTAAGWVSPTEVVNPRTPPSSSTFRLGNSLLHCLKVFEQAGLDPALTASAGQFGAYVLPASTPVFQSVMPTGTKLQPGLNLTQLPIFSN